MAALFAEHPRIIAERLHFPHDNPLVVGMRGIDETVIFVRRENGGHQQQTMFASLREFIAQPGELGRSRITEPSGATPPPPKFR